MPSVHISKASNFGGVFEREAIFFSFCFVYLFCDTQGQEGQRAVIRACLLAVLRHMVTSSIVMSDVNYSR